MALLVLSPVFFLIASFILIDSRGGVIYRQLRVGKDNRDFYIYKFRTMFKNSDRHGLITTGSSDARVTRAGRFLRKYKLDELPQLFNILKGDMSIVGPRPEVRKYVDLYSAEQFTVLSVRPGLTDYASLSYLNEGELLASHEDPEKLYVEEIMPAKLSLNLRYLKNKSMKEDFRIIFETLDRILSGN